MNISSQRLYITKNFVQILLSNVCELLIKFYIMVSNICYLVLQSGNTFRNILLFTYSILVYLYNNSYIKVLTILLNVVQSKEYMYFVLLFVYKYLRAISHFLIKCLIDYQFYFICLLYDIDCLRRSTYKLTHSSGVCFVIIAANLLQNLLKVQTN